MRMERSRMIASRMNFIIMFVSIQEQGLKLICAPMQHSVSEQSAPLI
jgi:hypothetical protein